MNNDWHDIFIRVGTSHLKNRHVLITGANGLIGGYLADALHHLNTRHQYNIRLTLTSLSKTPERLKHLIGQPDVTYISRDLSLNEPWTLDPVDYCFYCAGYAQPSKFIAQPKETLLINTVGVTNLFETVFTNPVATCVYLSSSEIYSASTKQEAHTEADIISIDLNNKRNAYILGKVCGESIVGNFRARHFNAISARVSLCYGPGILADDTRVLSEVVQKGLSDSPTIQLFDDGSAIRRYLHVSDLMIMLLNIAIFGKKNVYNVAGQEECTIYDLASMVATKLDKTVIRGQTLSAVAQSAPRVVHNSLERYKSEFGIFDFKPLDKGVSEFIEWYKANINKSKS